MRLIDADALFDELVEKQYSAQSMGILHTGYPNMMAIVSKQPTVDAAEVVHGEWIWNEDCECWVCSVCERSALNNYRGLSVNSEYCPHCGKKMDGGNRNDDA